MRLFTRVLLCCGVLLVGSSSKVLANKPRCLIRGYYRNLFCKSFPKALRNRTVEDMSDKIIGLELLLNNFSKISIPKASGEHFLQEISEEIEKLIKIYRKLCSLCISPDLENHYLGKKLVEIIAWEQKLESEPYLNAETEDECLLLLKRDLTEKVRQFLSRLKEIFVKKIFKNVPDEIYEMLEVGSELTGVQETALALFLTQFKGDPISSQELSSSRTLLTCFTLLFEDKNVFSEEILSKLATWIVFSPKTLEDLSER